MKQFIERWNSINNQINSPQFLSESKQRIAIGLILIIILIIRLATISKPALQWTAWKEIDYLYISQNYWQNGFDFLRPEVSWPAEPPRVTEMELPLVPFAAALLYQLFGYSVYAARMITLFAFLLMAYYVYKLAKRELGPFTGLTAAFAAGVLPLYHPFSRLLFTEPLLIAVSVVSLFYVAEWVDFQRKRDWFLALIALTLTFSLKLESLYLFLPIAWIAFRKYKWEFSRYKDFVILILIALILPIIWYTYAYYLEMTGAHLFGIFSGHNKSQTLTMLSELGWYRTMAGRIINGILGGFYGVLLFFAGLVFAIWKRRAGLFFFYLVAVGIYFALVAEGNIDAPYRQLVIIPPASVFLGLGVQVIIAGMIAFYQRIRGTIAGQLRYAPIYLMASILLIALIPLLEYKSVLGYDGPAHWDRWAVAQEIDKYSDGNSRLVVVGEYSKHVGGYDLSPVLYYYTGLQGWTLTPDDWDLEHVEELRKKGGSLLVVLEPYNDPYAVNYQPEKSSTTFVEVMRTHYPVLFADQGAVIIDLARPLD